MNKRVLMSIVVLAIVGTSAAVFPPRVFAQRAGETVQLSGQSYRVESSANGRVVLQLIPSLDGSWRIQPSGNIIINISGNNAVWSYFNFASGGYAKDAADKGMIKVGDQYYRNLRSTGNLTWSAQILSITFNNSNRNVATGSTWVNTTLTMDPSGDTFTEPDGTKWIRAGIQ